jgi:hypothetical protein
MPLALNIDPIVERLEMSLMPWLVEFARAIMESNGRVTAETHSNRHAPSVHVFGISCRPIGTDIMDETTVALVVNVIAVTKLSFSASVVRQMPLRQWASAQPVAQTSSYHKFSNRAIAKFTRETLDLLPVLVRAGHNQPTAVNLP